MRIISITGFNYYCIDVFCGTGASPGNPRKGREEDVSGNKMSTDTDVLQFFIVKTFNIYCVVRYSDDLIYHIFLPFVFNWGGVVLLLGYVFFFNSLPFNLSVWSIIFLRL